jgi:hypothetical protein
MAIALRPALTDDDGRFQLDGLSAGAYLVMVMTPGYVVAPEEGKRYLRPGDTATINLIKGGVITGKVTGSQGGPVVGTRVQAIRVRDLENRPAKPGSSPLTFLSAMTSEFNWKTDDRGVYRIYGLEPGVYHVAAGGGSFPYLSSPYDKDVPTYHPSGTADTAADVTVRAGEEATNIDIRYRAIAGYAISGSVSGPPEYVRTGVTVMLAHKASGSMAGTSYVLPGMSSNGFIFDAVGDGEYYLTAYAGSGSEETEIASSETRPVTVRGADVTGVNLALSPLGKINGQIVIEPAQGADLKQKCKDAPISRLDETVIRVRPSGRNKPEKVDLPLLDMFLSSAPGDKGEVIIRYVGEGRHYLHTDLPAGIWYIRAITLPGPAPASARMNAARDGLNLKAGGRLDGLVITLAEGAASISGKVVSAREAVALPSRLRLHLVPAEREAADETLRYAETVTKNDGSFELYNLPPGRYWAVVRAIPDEESLENPPPPLALEASGRAGLRFEGEAVNTPVELKACERLAGFTVRYSPPLTRPNRRSDKR